MIRFAVAAMVFVSFAGAQDVPPPPKPDTLDPSLAPLLESLKQTLLASGRVESSWTIGTNSYKSWQQITSAVVDARGCQVRWHFDSSFNGGDPRDLATSLFFEAIDTVETLTDQEAEDQFRSRTGQPRSETYSGTAYGLVINGNRSSLLFASEAQASKAAEAVRRAAQICRAVPIAVSAAAGAPNLADTLHFIEEKLNDTGAVNYRGINQNSDGSPDGTPISWSQRLTQAAADPSSCLVRLNLRRTVNGNRVITDNRMVISFRRVEKLEVATEQDANNRRHAQAGQPALTYKTDPVVYRLDVTYLGGEDLVLHFRDEEIANRVAKAMLHAIELCGGGSKEPF
jgi:hypothetical protein